MTREETKDLLAVVNAAYPQFCKNADRTQLTGTLNVWTMALADIECEWCSRALMEHIKTNRFPPAISEVRETALALKSRYEWQLRAAAAMAGFSKRLLCKKEAMALPGREQEAT